MGMDPRRAAAIARLAEEARAAGKAIRAYHGSPHSFSRFDSSKIGTGEGAQSYGHGLYFAGAEDTADFYRRKLTNDSDAPDVWARDYWEAQSAADAVGNPADAHDWLIRFLRFGADPSAGYPKAQRRFYRNALEYLLAQDPFSVPPPRRIGHMYEVELGVPEEALLDYDKPFSTPAGVAGAEVLRQDNPAAVSARALRAIQDGSWRMESFAGRSPYETAAVELTLLAKTRGGAKSLLDAGIPGVRYFDAQSRGAAVGTRNYVMFPGTEDHIRILRKYGLLAPMALPALQGSE